MKKTHFILAIVLVTVILLFTSFLLIKVQSNDNKNIADEKTTISAEKTTDEAMEVTIKFNDTLVRETYNEYLLLLEEVKLMVFDGSAHDKDNDKTRAEGYAQIYKKIAEGDQRSAEEYAQLFTKITNFPIDNYSLTRYNEDRLAVCRKEC